MVTPWQVPELLCLRYMQRSAVEALHHHHFWVTEQSPGICRGCTQRWVQQTDIVALTSHRTSPRAEGAQAALQSQQGGASRQVPGSAILLVSSFLLHAIVCVSKAAYWDRQINAPHCQQPTKWRLSQLKKRQACDTAIPAKGTDSQHGKEPLAGSVRWAQPTAAEWPANPGPCKKSYMPAASLLLHFPASLKAIPPLVPRSSQSPLSSCRIPAQLQHLLQVHMSTGFFPHVPRIEKIIY